MAIYHLSAQIISRKTGRSATAAAAYRAGEKIVDERTGEIHDYTRKGGVAYAQMVMPEGAWHPADRNELWNAVELKNKRADAQVAREFVVALPDELGAVERKKLAVAFTQYMADTYQIAADVCIHEPCKGGDKRNHHAHILTSTNRVTLDGFGNKVRELDILAHNRGGKLGQENEVEKLRAKWSEMANAALEAAGLDVRIDHRSYETQAVAAGHDIALMPTQHMGPAATAMERRGIRTDRGDENRRVQQLNQDIDEVRQLDAQIIDLEAERQRRAVIVPGIRAVATQDKKERFKSQLVHQAYGKTAERQMRGELSWIDKAPQNGKRHLELKRGTRIVDAGDSLTAVRNSQSVKYDAEALAILAKAKGFEVVQLNGTEEFKEHAWLALSAKGIDVRGYEPSDELRQRLDTMMKPKAKPKSKPVDDLPDMFSAPEPEPAAAPVRRRTRKDELREAFERGEHIELRGSDKDMIDELWKAAEEGSDLKQRLEDASNELYYSSGDSYDDIFPFI